MTSAGKPAGRLQNGKRNNTAPLDGIFGLPPCMMNLTDFFRYCQNILWKDFINLFPMGNNNKPDWHFYQWIQNLPCNHQFLSYII